MKCQSLFLCLKKKKKKKKKKNACWNFYQSCGAYNILFFNKTNQSQEQYINLAEAKDKVFFYIWIVDSEGAIQHARLRTPTSVFAVANKIIMK